MGRPKRGRAEMSGTATTMSVSSSAAEHSYAGATSVGAIEEASLKLSLRVAMFDGIVSRVAAKFGPAQREEAVAMGHGGFLQLPARSSTNRRFVFWLVRCIDPIRRGIVLSNRCFRPITEQDAGEVLGLGGGSIDIPFPHPSPEEGLAQGISKILALGYITDKITVSMLEKWLGTPMVTMSEDERTRFRIAFALLCEACILNPVRSVDTPICPSSLMTVRDPNLIGHLNWRKHALDIMFGCALGASADLLDGGSLFHMDFCWIIPQVVYFDMMQTGRGHVCGLGMPRAALYTECIARDLICMDAVHGNRGRYKDYGKARVFDLPIPAAQRLRFEPGATMLSPAVAPVADADVPVEENYDKQRESVVAPGVHSSSRRSLGSAHGWNSEVVERVSAVVHDNIAAHDLQQKNLRNHVESMLTSVTAMIDSRAEENITTSAALLQTILGIVSGLEVEVIDGELSFVKLVAAREGAVGAAAEPGSSSAIPIVVQDKGKNAADPESSASLACRPAAFGQTKVVNAALKQMLGSLPSGDAGGSGGSIYGNLLCKQGAANGAGALARSLVRTYMSPRSLDLNQRAVLRSNSGAVQNKVARRLDLTDVKDDVPGNNVDTSLKLGSTPVMESQLPAKKRAMFQAKLSCWMTGDAAGPSTLHERSLASTPSMLIPDVELFPSRNDRLNPYVSTLSKDDALYKKVLESTVNELDRVWFEHNTPEKICVAGRVIRKEFNNEDYMTKVGLDIVSRYLTSPSAIKSGVSFHPSTGRCLLGAGWTVTFSREYLKMSGIKMLFGQYGGVVHSLLAMAFVHLPRSWNLYTFDTLHRTVYVIDPATGPLTELSELRHKHGDTLSTLLEAFINCGSSICASGKLPHATHWRYKFHGTYNNQSTDTAVQILHHAMTFVPGLTPQNLSEDGCFRLKKKLLRNVLHMPENLGNIPSRMR